MSAQRLHRFLGLVLLIAGGFGVEANALADSTGHVYLSGELNHQGAVEIPADGKLTVSQAIIADGGLASSADPHHITVLRKKSDGSSQVLQVDWIEIVGNDDPKHPSSPHLEKDISLQSGDTIVVPKKIINF